MSITFKGLPAYSRVVGWWEGAQSSRDRHFGTFIPRIGLSSSRPNHSEYYYVQVFGRSKEGYELPLGKARLHLNQLSGQQISVPVHSPYGGKEGTMVLGGYVPPKQNTSKLGKISWMFGITVEETIPGDCKLMESRFMDHHTMFTRNSSHSFLQRVMMPSFKTSFTSAPLALFASLKPVAGYEDARTLNHFLKIALQRASINTSFREISDEDVKASVLSLFCCTPANTMPYTMDSRRGTMSEWFGSPRNRKTGDCEDVSQDTLMVFRALTNVSGLESYPDLKALQRFSQDFKCYMVLGTATSASAGGKSTGSLMAHMWNILKSNSEENPKIYLIESTGFVNPIPHIRKGVTDEGKNYMARLNSEPGDGGIEGGPYVGYLKRFLTDWPVNSSSSEEFVVSEFYVHLCYGVPHDGGDMISFHNTSGAIGPYFSKVLMGKDFTTKTIKGTGFNTIHENKSAKLFMDKVTFQIEPIPTYNYQDINALPSDSPILKFKRDIEDMVKQSGKNDPNGTDFDGKILILSELLNNDTRKGYEKILGKGKWLEKALDVYFDKVQVHTQVVCKIGFDPRNTIAAFQINFKLSEQNKSNVDNIAFNAPKNVTVQSLVF